MTEPLVRRLADALRKLDPNAPELQEAVCRYCAGAGCGWTYDYTANRIWPYTLSNCYYCGGAGSGYSPAFAKDLAEMKAK